MSSSRWKRDGTASQQQRIARRVDGDEAILARLALASSQPLAGRHPMAERDDLSRIEAVDAPDMQVRAAGLTEKLSDHALARRLRAKAVARAGVVAGGRRAP